MKPNPCYKCEERHTGCHAECDRYKTWQKEHQTEKDRILEARKKLDVVEDYRFEKIQAMRKRKRQKGEI